jgi:RNA polymerase primary sigma factor
MRDLHIGQTITNRESRSVESYLNEIGKVSLITAEEEADLARKIKAGDRAAVNRLAKVNLRFVVSVAKKYQNMGIPLGDLINEGNFGLIRAAEKFDETKGFKFISFAVWWIRQAILEAVSQQSRMIRLPNNQIGMMSRVNRTIAALEQTEERYPPRRNWRVIWIRRCSK